VRLNPAVSSDWWGGCSTVPKNVDTRGECNTDTAPPYTEVVPRELDADPPETALQFVNELPITAMRQSWTVVVPNDVG